MRTYLNTLLHRKRGAYGPLWIFELDPETWAIVWSGWLEDEVSCHLILSEDPQWFKRDWGMDGRRPNPTYKTQRGALEEVIRSLQAMKVDLEPNEAEDRKYGLYISDAEHDLRLLMNEESDESQANEDTVQEPEKIPTSPEALGDAQVVTPVKVSVKVQQAPPAPAHEALSAENPWGAASGTPTAINFRPDMSLHAKMEWVCDNVPKMSRLRILREGATLLCDHLIAKHYRSQD